jgi:hypothetical protein
MRTTSAQRVRVHRARRRRGKLRLTIDLHEDDLRQIALRGYEGAASSDRNAQAEPVTAYVSDTLRDDLEALVTTLRNDAT